MNVLGPESSPPDPSQAGSTPTSAKTMHIVRINTTTSPSREARSRRVDVYPGGCSDCKADRRACLPRHLLAERLEELLPNVRRVEVPGASHIMHEDNPQVVNEAIAGFLRGS